MVTIDTKDQAPPDYSESVARPPPVPTPPSSVAEPALGDFYVDSSGCDVSYDPAINADPSLMARFIRQRASKPPALLVRIRGTHQETTIVHATRLGARAVSVSVSGVTTPVVAAAQAAAEAVSPSSTSHHHDDSSSDDDSHGRRSRRPRRPRGPRRRVEQHITTVTDFDFVIDVGKYISTDPEYFVLNDSVAAFRGDTMMEVDVPHRRRAFTAEQAHTGSLQEGEKDRLERGEMPWQVRNGGGTRSLEQWTEDYVRDEGTVKDFKFTKVVYGWDLNSVTAAIRSAIASTFYSGKVEITVSSPSGNAIHVRPATAMSRMRANNFLRGALYATLVWPITSYFYEKQYRTCGAAYPLKQWVHLPDSRPGDDVDAYISRVAHPVDRSRFKATPEGISEVRGLREGEWFAMWEETIKSAVQNKVKNSIPLVDPLGAPNSMASKLDGYPGAQPGPSTPVAL